MALFKLCHPFCNLVVSFDNDKHKSLITKENQHIRIHCLSGIGAILKPGFWSLDYQSRDVDRSLILNHHTSSEAMQEEDSDNCLTELFGTR